MRKFRPATIRGRLVTVLAVSLCAVLVLLGVLVAGELDAYRDAERTTVEVGLAMDAQATVHELQRERGLTNGLLAGRTDYREALDVQRGLTDRALARFTEATAGIDNALLRAARERWAQLRETRAAVDAREAQRDPTFAYFTDGINELAQFGVAPERSRDRELLRGLAALTALGEAKEAAARSRGFLNGVLSAGRFKDAEYQSFAEIRAAQHVALADFRRSATPSQQGRVDAVLNSPAAQQAQAVEQRVLSAADGRSLAGLDSGAWWAAMTTVIDDVGAAQAAIGDEIRDRAAELRSDASAGLFAYGLFAALLVLAEIALTVIAVRSITRPLTLLAQEAEAMASDRLPDVVTRLRAGDHDLVPPGPVGVPDSAGREILAVAAAFRKVQDTAVQLAAEQAVMRRNTTDSLVDLARRNQNLVRRQLGFISRLEHEESDPTALGNLFELDHLATRRRRNAESLLVLVGETGRRRSAAPMHITDVVRAALSEVEDYRRVVLRRMDDIAVTGTVVTELSHLLAELVENALAFSPPDVEVEVYGRRIGHDYLVAVIDHGAGMTAAALETANARLSGRVDFLDAPTRSLGHHVVGRLARRIGAEVRVGESPVAGVTARVLLPATVLADPKQPPRAAQAAQTPPAAQAPHMPQAPQTPQMLPAPPTGSAAIESAPTGFAGVLDTTASPAASATLPPRILPQNGHAADSTTGYTTTAAVFAAPSPDARSLTADAAPDPTHAPPSSPQAGARAPVARTRNGLAKRVPRHRAPSRAPRHAPPPADVLAEPLGERSPDDVRSMLTSFRSGHSRGEVAEFGAAPAQAPHPTGAWDVRPSDTPYPAHEEDRA